MKIEIVVAPDGQTKVETKGFAGESCRQASEFIEKALGQRTGEQLTQDFYLNPALSQPLKEGV